MTRADLNIKIEKKRDELRAIHRELKDLVIKELKLSDHTRTYTEGVETIKIRENRKKVNKEVLRGWIHYTEFFKDESTGKSIPIKRSQIVMEDNNWII